MASRRALACLLVWLGLVSCAGSSERPTSDPESTSGVSSQSAPDAEAQASLREVLKSCFQVALQGLGEEGGFAQDPTVRVPFPPEAAFAEKALRELGMSPTIERFVSRLNGALEETMRGAQPILVSAIDVMDFESASRLHPGGETLATQKLRQEAEPQIAAGLKPKVATQLKSHGVDALWAIISERYNKLPWIGEEVDTDIAGYATQAALEGLFLKAAEQEKQQRNLSPASGEFRAGS